MVTDHVGDVGRHRNLRPEIPVMVLLRKNAGVHTGPNINGRAAAEPEGSPEPVITTGVSHPPRRCEWALPLLGGLRRSFTASRCRAHSCRPRTQSRVDFELETHFRCYIVSQQTPQPATPVALTDQFLENGLNRDRRTTAVLRAGVQERASDQGTRRTPDLVRAGRVSANASRT